MERNSIMLKIVTVPNPILNKKLEPVTDISEISKIVPEMSKLMEENNGCGLAANQVNIDKSFFIISETGLAKDVKVYINPLLLQYYDKISSKESCLSIPYTTVKIKRYKNIFIKAYDLDGKVFEENLTNNKAIIFQHEYDHINGILITDKGLAI